MARSKAKTSDAVEILRRRYVEGDATMESQIREVRDNLNLAQQLYDLRTAADLTQQQLAERIGTTASVICRLEDADYEGHSLSMLRRVAGALDCRVEVRIVQAGVAGERRTTEVTDPAQAKRAATVPGRSMTPRPRRSLPAPLAGTTIS